MFKSNFFSLKYINLQYNKIKTEFFYIAPFYAIKELLLGKKEKKN